MATGTASKGHAWQSDPTTAIATHKTSINWAYFFIYFLFISAVMLHSVMFCCSA